MCGITGFWSVDTREKEAVARRMADALRHFASGYLSTSFGMLWTLKVYEMWSMEVGISYSEGTHS